MDRLHVSTVIQDQIDHLGHMNVRFYTALACVGDRVQSFNAEIGVGEKTFNSRYWVYDLDRSELICDFSVVSLAFDLEARRSVVIPDALRESMQQRLHPDLARG